MRLNSICFLNGRVHFSENKPHKLLLSSPIHKERLRRGRQPHGSHPLWHSSSPCGQRCSHTCHCLNKGRSSPQLAPPVSSEMSAPWFWTLQETNKWGEAPHAGTGISAGSTRCSLWIPSHLILLKESKPVSHYNVIVHKIRESGRFVHGFLTFVVRLESGSSGQWTSCRHCFSYSRLGWTEGGRAEWKCLMFTRRSIQDMKNNDTHGFEIHDVDFLCSKCT